MQVLLDEVIHTDYGQFDVVWGDGIGFDGDNDRFFAGQANGWVGAADPTGIYLVLGRRSGGSQVRIELHSEPPAADQAWEDVVEVSAEIPTGVEVGWAAWAGESSGPLALPAGSYRVRVSARGRDAGAEDEFSDGVVDFYVMQWWPAPAAPDAIVETTSQDAAYWHGAWGGRR